MTDPRDECIRDAFAQHCRLIATRLKRQAAWTTGFVTVSYAIAIGVMSGWAWQGSWIAGLAAAVAFLLACGSLALAALLAFDAALFTLMANAPDEMAGGRSVDEFLAGAELKPLPAATRTTAERMSGACRLMRRQLLVVALFALATLAALAMTFA